MHLNTSGLKAHDINIDLGERTLLAGPCGTGKSTVLDALRWLVLGYVPSYGKRLADTAALMRGREMSATLTLDDGRTLSRELARTKGDRLTQSVRCSWLPEGSTSDEHEAAALALVGGDADRAAELLDVRRLLADTGPRRTASIQRLLAAGEMEAGERGRIVAELTVRRLTATEDRELADWRDLLPLIPGAGKDGAPHTGVRAILADVQGELKATLAKGAGPAKSWAAGEKARATKETREKRAALAEIEARLGELPAIDEEALAADEERLREIDEALGAAKARAAEADAINRRISAADQRIEQARAASDAARERLDALASEARGHEEMRARVSGIHAELEEIADPAEPDFAASAELQRTADALREEAEAIAVPAAPSALPAERAEAALVDAEAALARAESDPWCRVVERARSIEAALTSIPRVPARLTDHVRPILAEMVELAESHGWGDETALRQAIADAQADYEAKAAAYEMAGAAYDTALARHATLRREADEADRQAEAMRRELRKQYEAERRAADRRRQELARERGEITDALDLYDRKLRAAEEARERAEADHAAAQEARRSLGEPVSAEAPATTERDALAADIRARRDQAATRAELTTLSRDLARLDAEREVYAAIEWACSRCQEIEVERAGGVLREPMRAVLAAAGRREVPFVEASGGETRIGWVRPDGLTVPVGALCGGEWPVFVAALTAAMLKIVAPELPLLLLEAGETDDEHLGHILGGIAGTAGVRAIVAVQRDA